MTRLSLAKVLVAPMVAIAQPAPPTTPAKTTTDKAFELAASGKLDDALAELTAAAKADPTRPPPLVSLAELCYRAGRGADARRQLERAVADDPRHPAAYLLNASFAFGEGRLTDTALSCRTALELAADPRWDAAQRKRFARDARLGLAAALEARGDWAGAKEPLTGVLNDDPKDPDARPRLAAVLFHLGQPEQAFAELAASARDHPQADPAELRMARLWIGVGDAGKAEEWLKKGVTAHPTDPRPARAYAGWLLDADRAADAAAYVEAAGKLDPDGRDGRSLRGLYARFTKDYSAAEGAFEKLLADRPGDTFAAWNLALALAESADAGKRKRAVELAEAEVRRDPRSPEGYAVLGWCYLKAGQPTEAEAALGKAAVPPVRPETAYFVGRLLADKGKPDDAVRWLKEATAGKVGFAYRADAAALLAELEKKAPPADKK